MATFSVHDLKPDETPAPAPARATREADRRAITALAETMSKQSAASAFSPVVLTGTVRLLDYVAIFATGALVHHFYVSIQSFGFEYLIALLAVPALAAIVFQALGINHVAAFRAPIRHGFRMAGGLGLVFLAAMAVVFFLKLEGTFSRVWMLIWFASALASLMIERGIVAICVRALTRNGRLERRTVVVGGGPAAEAVLTDLARQKDTDLRIFGFFDDRIDERSPDVVAGFPKLGNVDALVEFSRSARIDLVIFALPITAEQRLLQMLRKLWVLPIDIRLAAHSNKLRFRPRSYSYIGQVPVLDVFDKPIADWDVVLKAAFDRIVGAICLVLLTPVMLVIAAAIKFDSPGPVFFRQKRYGFNNEQIDVFKFRSLYANQLDYSALKSVTRDDPRVTRVGRFIRKTSLDELPQLINVVVKGNLSLVGPRPHALHARAQDRNYDEVVDGYFARHRVRPGITGWAQVNGWRGETDTSEKLQKRVEHDLYYIENWSLLFDAYILCITPFALIKAENAY